MDSHPYHFHSDLTEERLNTVSMYIFKIVNEALELHTHELDDNYTTNTTVFGWVKNLLLDLAKGDEHPWLKVVNPGYDYVLQFGSMPFRVTTEYDANHPKKQNILRQSSCEIRQRALDFGENDKKLNKCRLYIEMPVCNESDPSIFLVGFDYTNNILFTWKYQQGVSAIYPVLANYRPASVLLNKAQVNIHEKINEPKKAVECPNVDQQKR